MRRSTNIGCIEIAYNRDAISELLRWLTGYSNFKFDDDTRL